MARPWRGGRLAGAARGYRSSVHHPTPMPHNAPDLPTAPALADAAAALGRAARRDHVPLDDLLARVESMAHALARQESADGTLDFFAPERDAALLHLWRTAWHAYEAHEPVADAA